MTAWILVVTYLYSSLTAVTTTPAAFETKDECDAAVRSVYQNTTRVVAECRAVQYVNKSNTP